MRQRAVALIDEDVQRADQAILDLRDVGAGHACGTGLWRHGLPLAPSDAVMAKRRRIVERAVTFIDPDRRARDRDNLLSGCKPVVDSVADAKGVNDSSLSQSRSTEIVGIALAQSWFINTWVMSLNAS